MLVLTPSQWLIAILAALCVGLSKSGFGGFGMLTVVLMAEILPARESTGALLPLLICGDIFAVALFRKHAQWRHLLRLIPPTLLGVIAGFFLMGQIPDALFRPVLGIIVLALALLQLLRRLRGPAAEQIPHTRRFAWMAGGASGFTTMLANAAGPLMALYMLALRLPKYQILGTGAWFFLLINLVKVPFSASLGLITTQSLLFDAMLTPAVIAGIFIGAKTVALVPQKLFEDLLILFVLITSLRLLGIF